MPEIKSVDNLFINKNDAFANSINAKANELYYNLINLDVEQLNTADLYKDYFSKHHLGRRLFFSLQSSAHIIYHSVNKTGKPVSEITFIDYGAGLGTLFMLAGKIGFKKTAYNDYFPDWHQPAKVLCNALQIKIDHFVEGGIDDVTAHAKSNNLKYDIIASRNVIEHIYSLPHFYKNIFEHNNKAVIFSTTTANFHNPVMRWYHYSIHRKGEKSFYRNQRIKEIQAMYPSISNDKLTELSELTRGKAQKDFTQAVTDFMTGKPVVKDKTLRTNTCDCITGVWNEHLLSKKDYEKIVTLSGFNLQYTPGFWDTNYKSPLMNFAAKIFNNLILLSGNSGKFFSPFVNVVAYN